MLSLHDLRKCSPYNEVVMPLHSRNASKKFLKGEEVRAFRISRALTQTELAEWLGLTPQAVGKYEERGVTKATALALSAINRGLTPFKPTKEDLQAVEAHDRLKLVRKESK
jgi:DNA-binding XRE family transcriptional regulator